MRAGWVQGGLRHECLTAPEGESGRRAVAVAEGASCDGSGHAGKGKIGQELTSRKSRGAGQDRSCVSPGQAIAGAAIICSMRLSEPGRGANAQACWSAGRGGTALPPGDFGSLLGLQRPSADDSRYSAPTISTHPLRNDRSMNCRLLAAILRFGCIAIARRNSLSANW